MTREELIAEVRERYSCGEEYPWDDENCIFRHPENRKWFAAVLRVGYRRLGIDREGPADLVNLKCPPQLMGAYRGQPGFQPCYHMNREHWISALLDGSAEDGAIRELLEISFEATRSRKKPPRKRKDEE